MQSQICDVCGKPIDKDNPAPAPVSSQAAFVIDGKLHPFTYSLRIESYSFSRPGFDVCQKCLLNALANPPAANAALKTALLWLVLSLALMFCATAAKAQSSGPHLGPLTGGTNFVAAASTNTYTLSPQVVSEFDHVGMDVSFSCPGANNSNVTFRVVQAYNDTSHFESLPSLSGTVAASGTTPVVAGFDLFCPASSYVALATIENPGPSALTNVWVKWILKSPKRGANTSVTP